MIRIALADDHTLMREGLKRILEGAEDIQVVAEATDGAEALALARQGGLDVIVLDLSMPVTHGVDLVRAMRREAPGLPILAFTMHDELDHAVETIRAGAQGYLTKDRASDSLITAIRKVAAGRPYISNEVAELLAMEKGRPSEELPHKLLSNREFEVFTLLASGKTTGEIATLLNLSAKTVSTHKGRLLTKMNLRSPAHLVQYAIRHRLVAQVS